MKPAREFPESIGALTSLLYQIPVLSNYSGSINSLRLHRAVDSMICLVRERVVCQTLARFYRVCVKKFMIRFSTGTPDIF